MQRIPRPDCPSEDVLRGHVQKGGEVTQGFRHRQSGKLLGEWAMDNSTPVFWIWIAVVALLRLP